MAKEVENVERETVQPHPHALEKEQVTLTCDDGSAYVFEKAADSPKDELRLARRVKPSGDISTSNAPLPAAVEETLDAAISRWRSFGDSIEGWYK
jgi:hypothetical protein